MKNSILLLCFISIAFYCKAERPPKMYQLNWKVDLPLTVVGIGMTAYGFDKIGSQEGIDSLTVVQLDPQNVNFIDRPATRNAYSAKAAANSDIIFNASFPIGLALLLDRNVRYEAGTVGLLYLQSVSIAAGIYAMSAGHTSRFRPYAYNENTEFSRRSNFNTRNSFFGGHAMITAVTTFFAAKVYSDYHPTSDFRYVAYGIAGAATFTNAYLRYRAGMHFPTDLVLGVAVGVASGILVPELHKKSRADKKMSIFPFSNFETNGLAMFYKF